MSPSPTQIDCDIDFERPGRQVSTLRLHHSDNQHAYGHIPIPIAQIKGGSGPTILLSAGNHGDEYEGQIILRRLLRKLQAERINGRVILLPALNYPAVLADSRISPLDDGNMNRAFPGSADAPPTGAIAHFVDSVLLPLCDVVVDLHSGGKVSEYLPCAFIYHCGDTTSWQRKWETCRVFGAPYTVVVNGGTHSLSGAAEQHGCLMIATELAGGGTISPSALEIGYSGVMRLLHHFGVLSQQTTDLTASATTRFIKVDGPDSFVVSPADGIFEPTCRLGEQVQAGQLAGLCYAADDPDKEPLMLNFERAGILVCRRVSARIRRGDYVFHLGQTLSPEQNPPGESIR